MSIRSTYLIRRLGFLVWVVIGVSLLTFMISRVVPADPARLLLGREATQQQLVSLRHDLGLDRPLPVQYLSYMGALLRGDLGLSLTSRRPVLQDLREYFPATLELSLTALLLCVVLGIPLGIWAAIRHGHWPDRLSQYLATAGVALPIFWFGLVLQVIFYGQLHWFPAGQRLGVNVDPPTSISGLLILDALLRGNGPALLSSLQHLVLPAFTLAASSLATVVRVTRASLMDSFSEDYIRTALAKGLTRLQVVHRHALRNALLPTVTILGLQTGNLLAGAFLVEVVFNWPGIGLYSVRAVQALDYAAIMGVTIVTALIYSVVNVLVDVLYTVIDPRVRYG